MAETDFLSAWEGTERVIVGHKPDGEPYWVDVKKCLSRLDSEKAEEILSSSTTTRQTGERKMVTGAYRTFVVAKSIVAWNLDDKGVVWPYNNDAAILRGVHRFPDPVFHEVFLKVDELNAPMSSKQRRDFRDPSGDGDQVGEVRAVDADEPADLRAGEGAVDAPWGTAGDLRPETVA